MNTTKKTTKETVSAAAAEKTEVVETIATLYTNGVERLAEVQKKGIDLAVKQNAELLDAWKKIAQSVSGRTWPRSCLTWYRMLSIATQTRRRAQLTWFSSRAMRWPAWSRSAPLRPRMQPRALRQSCKQTVDQSVAAQKKALDYSVAQTKVAFETAKKQFGMTGTPAEAAAESFQRGVDGLIEAQKELLDIAAKPFTSVH